MIKRLHQELNLIPEKHKDIIESTVKELEFIEKGISRYNRKTGVLYIRNDFTEGELVHECGHAIETKLDLYHNDKFLKVLNNGLEDITPFDIIDDDSFVELVQRIENDKFISDYQSVLYPEDIDGIEQVNYENGTFNTKVLGECFSEGYREYLINPQNLSEKDKELFDFINDKMV